jgi:Cu2+-exporting ATPase
MPVADGAGDIRPAAEDPLHAAAHSDLGGHTRTEADHAGHGDTSLAGHDERALLGGRAGDDEYADHGGHGTGHGGGDHVAVFRRLCWLMLALALALAVPTVRLSVMFADIVGYGLPDAPA